MIKLIKKLFQIKIIIVIIALGMFVRSSFYLFVYTMSQVMHRHEDLLEPGTQFAHFNQYLKDQESIGFLTSKDMSSENNDGFFSQAQYILAPVILELNNPKNQFNILDYEQKKHIIYAMRALKSFRVSNNEYGQALIRRKPQ